MGQRSGRVPCGKQKDPRAGILDTAGFLPSAETDYTMYACGI